MSLQFRAGSLLSSSFVLPTFIGAVFFFVFHSFLLLPVHIEELGGNLSQTGFIMGISGLSTLVFTPLSGILADRYGRKIFIVLGLLMLFLSCAGFVFIQTLDWRIYALRMLQGAAFSFFFTATGAVVTGVAPEGRKVQAMGIYGMFTIVGYALGPYFGKMFIDGNGFAELFIFVSLVSACGTALSFFVKDGWEPEKPADGETKNRLDLILPPFSKPLAVACLMLFISGWVFLSQFSFVSISSRSAGVERFYLFFVCFTAAVLFVRIFLGWAPDRYGIAKVCPPFLFVSFMSAALLAFSGSQESVAAAGTLFGISHGFTYPSLYLLAMENCSNSVRAKVFAVCSASFTSGGMLGTFISGIVAGALGYLAMYLTVAAVSLLGFVFFVSVYARRPRPAC